MVYFTKLIGRPVFDSKGNVIGKLIDLCFKDGVRYAEVSSIVVLIQKKRLCIPWRYVKEFRDRPGTHRLDVDIYLNVSKDELASICSAETLRLSKILDRQIIDTEGARIVRVNDIFLAKVEDKFRVVAVDVSTAGMFRRLGWVFSGASETLKMHEHLIPWESVEPLEKNISNLRIKVQKSKIANMHPADIADVMQDLSLQERILIFNSLEAKKAAQTFIEAQPEVKRMVFRNLNVKRISELLQNLPPKEAVKLLNMIPRIRHREFLNQLSPEHAKEIRKLLGYGEDTAGAMMHKDFMTIPEYFTVSKSISYIRKMAPKAQNVAYLYARNKEGRLTGLISLRSLITANPKQKIADIIPKEFVSVKVNTPREDVFKLMDKYNLLAIPVVDSTGNIMGVIRINDILDLILPAKIKKQRISARKYKIKKKNGKNGKVKLA